MKRGKLTKKNFGIAIVAGALVFFMNVLFGGTPDEFYKENNSESIAQQSENETIETTEVLEVNEMTVHFLDVNQGLAILVQMGDEVLIYDGGGRDTSSFVVSYLKEQGITEIDYLISSHYDSDHVSGLIGCLYAFDVKNVIGSNYVHDSKLYSSFMNAVENEGLEVQYPAVGTEYTLCDATITILSPKEIVNDSNSNSVAIKLTFGECDFIFTGDTDYNSESAMIASGIDLDCEVLSLAHHGSASGTSEAFLIATTPEYAVISCGKDNGYGHPHEEVVGMLKDMEIDLFRSDVQGTVIAITDGEKITWSKEPCNDYRDGN